MSDAAALPPLSGKQAQAWDALLQIAPSFGEGWTLIGGQMVLLHQVERQPAAGTAAAPQMRWSYDIDVVVDLRADKSQMGHIDATLRAHGFAQEPSGHRYVDADGTTFDVLAPDHLGIHLPVLGRGRTLQTSGGTQALKRSQSVEVEHGTRRCPIYRPDLVGAILIKIAAASGPPGGRGNMRHTRDLVTLAELVTPADIAAAELTRNERTRIRRAIVALGRLGDDSVLAATSSLERLSLSPRGRKTPPSTRRDCPS